MVVEQRPNSGFYAFLCDTVTGQYTRTLPLSDIRWGSRMNEAGPISAVIPVTAEQLSKLQLRAASTPVRQCLGIAYDNNILECGPIWRRRYSQENEQLVLQAAGLWSLLDKRKVLPGLAYFGAGKPMTRKIVITNKSLGAIAGELVRVSIQDNPYPAGLNIVLPQDSDGKHERTYNGYDLGWLGSRLHELTQVNDGPDIRFRPRFNGSDPSIVEWVMETGTQAQPLLQQYGNDWVFDGSVENSPVVSIDVEEDGTGVAARSWSPGSGQAEKMKVAFATNRELLDKGWPWTETDEASKDIEDQTVLQSSADRKLADARYPWEQWSVRVKATATPRLGTYNVGDWVQLVIPKGHPWLVAGTPRTRIMAIDGDQNDIVTLTLAPMQGTYNGTAYGEAGTVLVEGNGFYPSDTLFPANNLYPQGSYSDTTQLD